jgi:cardiolipin synthase
MFSRDLQQRLQQAIDQSNALNPADWQRRGWVRRTLSWLAYGGVRLLVGLVGGGRWV